MVKIAKRRRNGIKYAVRWEDHRLVLIDGRTGKEFARMRDRAKAMQQYKRDRRALIVKWDKVPRTMTGLLNAVNLRNAAIRQLNALGPDQLTSQHDALKERKANMSRERDEYIERLWREGETDTVIGKKVGLGASRVKQIRIDHRLVERRRQRKPPKN